MPFLGELAALGTSLCFAFGSTFFTLAGRELGSILTNRVRLLLALLLVMVLHTLLYGQPFPVNAGADRWLWLGISGIIGFLLGDAFLFQAFIMIGPRLSMLMMALAPVLGAVIAWIFLHETLALQEIIGITVTLAGILVVIGERRATEAGTAATTDRRRYVIGLLCGFGGALGQAGGMILSKIGLAGDFPALSGTLIRLATAVVVIWVITIVRGQVASTYRTLRERPRAFQLLAGGTVLGPVMGVWLSLVAVQNANIGVASTLSSLTPIFLIPISYFMFKERATKQAVVGTVIAIVGMVLLFV